MRIAKVEVVEVDLEPGRFRAGISHRKQDFVEPRQPDIELLAKRSPSNWLKTGWVYFHSVPASFYYSHRQRCCSRQWCSNIEHQRRKKKGVERVLEWHRHLQAAGDFHLFVSVIVVQRDFRSIPEWVMFRRAPVAFLWTLMSFDFAKRVRGPNAPDLAIIALLSSCVARFVMQPTALHCTSTFGDIICRMRGVRPPSNTIATLFSAKLY